MENTERLSVQMLSIRQVLARLSIGRSTLYELLDSRSARYQPSMPKPVRIGRSTRFYEHEINAFLLSLSEEREGSRR